MITFLSFYGLAQKIIYDSLNSLKEYVYTQPQKTQNLALWLLDVAKKNKDVGLEQATLFQVANHYYFTAQYSKADSLYQRVIEIGNRNSKDTLLNLCKVRRVYVMQTLGKWDSAYILLHKLVIEIQKKGDTTAWISALNSLGLQYEHHYLQDSALYYYRRGLKLAEKINDEYQYAYLLNNIGLLKYQSSHYAEAEQDFKESYQKAVKIKNMRLQTHTLNNLGITYIAQKKLDSAISYLNLLAKITKRYNYVRELGIAYHNLARCYQDKKQFNKALSYFDSSASLISLLPEKIYSIRPYNGYASVYQEMGKYKEAILYAEKALSLCQNTIYIEDIILAHQTLSLSYEALKNYIKALEHYKAYKKYSDSLTVLNKQKLIAEYQAQYQVEKKEKEIQKLEKEKQKQHFKNQIALLFISFVGICSIGVIYLYYSRHKRKMREKYAQQLTLSIEEERSRIARELHDEVGQTLSAIKNKLYIHKNELPDFIQDTEKQLSDTIEQVRGIAQSLYPPYLRKVKFEKAIETLLQRVRQNTDLYYTLEIDVPSDLGELLSQEAKLHLYRIIQECLNNTVKHAEATAVKISIEQKNHKLYLIYQDNGKGISHKGQLNGMGMLSIQERVRMLQGNMDLKNTDKGIKLQFIFNIRSLCP
ncbi:MAG: sensor histidine kinase [Bacteroidia bacterium]|nr:sensor histidine kinase [Bacteroidia bacterium]MDW8345534.1 sensor histidine kinase [Bacteroidia bacterium]